MTASVIAIRRGIRDTSTVLDQAQATAHRPAAFTYVPPTHARALDPDATLVEGIRGAGKSFWFSQLASPEHRSFVQKSFPETHLPSKLEVAQGFGMGLSVSQAPDAETLADLVAKFRPRAIWRAVVARHAGIGAGFPYLKNWAQRVEWVQANAETFAAELEAADQRLVRDGKTLLVLFDALDRLADDWHHIHPLAKGLLQVALDMRSTRAVRCKVYVRPDLLQDANITSFPDYSKLLASKASLAWRRADLYALLYQCLGNADARSGTAFRTVAAQTVNGVTLDASPGGWQVPSQLRSDEELQEALFERLAGKAMGRGTKRGKPYTWLVNHLQDGLNQVSPRSYYAALGTAASETGADYELPLDYRSIQRGVQQASQIRVQEITEDYPWVELVMAPLRGNLTVPCSSSDIEKIWKAEKTLAQLESRLKAEGRRCRKTAAPEHRSGINGHPARSGVARYGAEDRCQTNPDAGCLSGGLRIGPQGWRQAFEMRNKTSLWSRSAALAYRHLESRSRHGARMSIKSDKWIRRMAAAARHDRAVRAGPGAPRRRRPQDRQLRHLAATATTSAARASSRSSPTSTARSSTRRTSTRRASSTSRPTSASSRPTASRWRARSSTSASRATC